MLDCFSVQDASCFALLKPMVLGPQAITLFCTVPPVLGVARARAAARRGHYCVRFRTDVRHHPKPSPRAWIWTAAFGCTMSRDWTGCKPTAADDKRHASRKLRKPTNAGTSIAFENSPCITVLADPTPNPVPAILWSARDEPRRCAANVLRVAALRVCALNHESKMR